MTVSDGVSPSPKGKGAEPARSPSKSTTALQMASPLQILIHSDCNE